MQMSKVAAAGGKARDLLCCLSRKKHSFEYQECCEAKTCDCEGIFHISR